MPRRPATARRAGGARRARVALVLRLRAAGAWRPARGRGCGEQEHEGDDQDGEDRHRPHEELGHAAHGDAPDALVMNCTRTKKRLPSARLRANEEREEVREGEARRVRPCSRRPRRPDPTTPTPAAIFHAPAQRDFGGDPVVAVAGSRRRRSRVAVLRSCSLLRLRLGGRGRGHLAHLERAHVGDDGPAIGDRESAGRRPAWFARRA